MNKHKHRPGRVRRLSNEMLRYKRERAHEKNLKEGDFVVGTGSADHLAGHVVKRGANIRAGAHSYYVRDVDGLDWIVEARKLRKPFGVARRSR